MLAFNTRKQRVRTIVNNADLIESKNATRTNKTWMETPYQYLQGRETVDHTKELVPGMKSDSIIANNINPWTKQ